MKRGAVRFRQTDCTDPAAGQRPRAPRSAQVVINDEQADTGPPCVMRNREDRLTSGLRRPFRRGGQIAAVTFPRGWRVNPCGPYRLDRPQVDISGWSRFVGPFCDDVVMSLAATATSPKERLELLFGELAPPGHARRRGWSRRVYPSAATNDPSFTSGLSRWKPSSRQRVENSTSMTPSVRVSTSEDTCLAMNSASAGSTIRATW